MNPGKRKTSTSNCSPAGWSSSTTKDKQSVAILTDILTGDKKDRFLPSFADENTHPNLDGSLTVGIPENDKDRIQPLITFGVQIKTLPKDYSNNNRRKNCTKYKFSCPSDVIATVARKVVKDPVLLFMVDCVHKKAFYKYLSVAYCVQKIGEREQGSYTIYFDDGAQLDSLDKFYETLIGIQKQFQSEKADIVADDAIPSDLYRGISNACQKLNGLLDNELRFIKKSVFPFATHFGIACNLEDEIIATKIFVLRHDVNDGWIREFDWRAPSDSGSSLNLLLDPGDLDINIAFKEGYSPQKRVDRFIRSAAQTFCKRLILPVHALSDSVLQEAAFYFLDTLACRLDYRRRREEGVFAFEEDELEVKELAQIWQAVKDSLIYKADKVAASASKELDTVTGDPLSSSDFEENAKRWHTPFMCALDNPLQNCALRASLRGRYPYQFIGSIVAELQLRNIDTVARLWKKRNVRKTTNEREACELASQIDRGYTKDEYYMELEKLFTMLEEAYAKVASSLFDAASAQFVERGTLAFFLNKDTYEPRIAYAQTDENTPLKTECVFDPKLGVESLTEYAYRCETPTRIDFSKLPLYTVLDYFVTRKLREAYKIGRNAEFGELKKQSVRL